MICLLVLLWAMVSTVHVLEHAQESSVGAHVVQSADADSDDGALASVLGHGALEAPERFTLFVAPMVVAQVVERSAIAVRPEFSGGPGRLRDPPAV